ncbi:type II toxin-antitoxin system mRNA interferase toxin, RelE/StbE family [Bordetella petrii]|nr:type II toxin-antitoxin system mRNA interferase toxin, RelE/StbE family [Bordetella petrii]
MSGGGKLARIVWRPEARADRIAIMEYIAQDNPLAAIDLDDEIEDKANNLLLHPKLYKAGRAPGTREMVVRPNFIVVYELTGTDVVILNVLHSSQQWPAAETM